MASSSRIVTAPGGPEMSRIVAGCWRMADWSLSVPERVRWIERCLELGITTFDHAYLYGHYAVEGLFGETTVDSSGSGEQRTLPAAQ